MYDNEPAAFNDFKKLDPESILDEEDEMLLKAWAQDEDTPQSILMILANHSNYNVSAAVAKNLSSSREVLLLLSNHSETIVRQAVAENPKTIPEILDRLANDEDCVSCVARNTNTESATLARILLSSDKRLYRFMLFSEIDDIVQSVLENPSIRLEAVFQFLLKKCESDFSEAIVINPNFTKWTKLIESETSTPSSNWKP